MALERKKNNETVAKESRTLEHLMTFLRLEIQAEEMLQLAKSGIGTIIRKIDPPTKRVKPTVLRTASALILRIKGKFFTMGDMKLNSHGNVNLRICPELMN
ncbi:hypothetical protein TNIN_133471 [Trichonephila inaurata madagascariensis]|uniref:Uncharacterized protein n=1 Tax=Trichonephila inaurata madagascariensis TaxID=2747483 RepID=A0A8X6XDD5_9ARAC|nr:hypothetical protein TNIN_133471 [Trichonephila inaurata madagascariensis]